MANGFMTPVEALYGIQQAEPGMRDLLAEMASASAQMAAASSGPQVIPGTGGLTSEGLLQKEVAAKEAQDRAQEVAASANLFPALNKAAEDIARLSALQSEKLKELEDVSNHTGFFDYIADAWKAPGVQDEYDKITNAIQSRSNTAQALNSLTQQSAQTAKVVSTAITADTIAKMREALGSYNAQVEAGNRFKAAQMGVEGIKAALDMDDRRLKLYQAQRTMELQERSEARAQAQFNLSMERERRLNEQAALQVKAIKESEQSDQMIYDLYAAGARDLGQEPIPYGPKFMALNKVAGETVKSLVTRGLRVVQSPIDPATGVSIPVSHGLTIADREDVWEKTGVTPNTPQSEHAIKMQYDAKEKARKLAVSTDKNAIADAAEKVFQSDFKAEQNNIRPGSMFEAPSYEVIEKSTIGASPIWNQIIKPIYTAANASKSAVDPQLVFDTLYQASAKDKKISTSQAAEFYSNLFTQSIALNNSIHRFKAWTGMEQNKFGVSIKVGKRPVTEMSMTAVQATGAALAASGVAAGPGLLIAGAGTVGKRMLGDTISINAANMAEVQAAMGMRIASDIGLEFNLAGEVSPKRRGFYNQPLFKSSAAIERD